MLTEQLAEHERLKQAGRVVRFVFHRKGKPIKDLRKAWETAFTAAGLPGRLLHDFRRIAVRNLERGGVARSGEMAMVGHKTDSIYPRYAIVDSEALRDAATKIDRADQAPSANGTIRGTVGGAAAPRRA